MDLVYEEFVGCFGQASAALHRTTKGLNRAGSADPRFQFYVMQLMVPVLTGLFAQIGAHSTGSTVIGGCGYGTVVGVALHSTGVAVWMTMEE